MSHTLLSKTGLTYFWGKLKAYFAKGNGRIFYGTCDTAAGTAAKVVTCPSFTSNDLENGTLLIVKFANANSASVSSLSLNVNDTGANNVRQIRNASVMNLYDSGDIRATTHLFVCAKGDNTAVWFLTGPETNTTYSAMTQAEIDAGTGATGRRITPALLRDNFYTEDEVDALIAGVGGTPVATSQPAGGMLPNVLYKLGTLSGSVTLSLASPTDNTIENEYHFTFDTSSTAPTITWPSNLTWSGGSAPTVNASKHYEVSIEDGYAYATEF